MRTIVYVTTAALLVGGLGLSGCKKSDQQQDPGTVAQQGPVPGPCDDATAKGPLRWFEDDYDGALACARATKRPLVVDMWAPWCHTCLSMSATVLVDPSLGPVADRYVFLALDTDRPGNAAAAGKFALQNWPTYFVLDPTDESIQARWLGAATANQFRLFLKDGEHGVLAKAGAATLDPLLAKVRDGDVAATRKDWATADASYGAALAAAPPEWPRRSDVLVGQISARWKKGDIAGCLQLAATAADQTGTSANATDFLAWAMACAGDETADAAAAQAVREKAVEVLSRVSADASAPLTTDDRSDLLANLRGALDKLGRADEAKQIATAQRDLLDAAAAAAKTPAEAMTFNWQRADVYVYLGLGEQILPALAQSTKDLPREYDPPYRLAWVYMKLGKAADALTWAKDAAGKAYGPRKVRVQGLIVEAAKALGDVAAERAARTELVAVLESLPKEQAQPEALAKAKADLAAMDAGAGSATGSASATR